MSTENQVDLSAESIAEIIASGDPDAIEQALLAADSLTTEIDVVEAPAEAIDSSIVEVNAEQEVITAEQVPVITEQAPTEQADIATKDGENTIPFQVLSDTRTALSETQGQLQTIEQQNAELTKQLEEQSRLLSLSQNTLESNDLKVPVLPEHEKIDPEFLKNSADYGEVGEALRIIAQQNEHLKQQLQSQVATTVTADSAMAENPAQQAFDANPELQQIFNDPAQKTLAIEIDKQLQSSHSHLPVAERFQEVVKQFKQQAQQTVDTKIPAQPTVPSSISDVPGAPPVIQSTLLDQLANANVAQVQGTFEGMDSESINDFIDNIKY